MEPKNKRGQRKVGSEITSENYMEFSAKELYQEIERLRNQPSLKELRTENINLKRNMTRIFNLAKGYNKLSAESAEQI